MSKDQVFWMEDPAVLMNKDYIREIWPQKTMEPPAKLNAITRFVILATILGYLVTSSFSLFILGAITLGIIVGLPLVVLGSYLASRKADLVVIAEA